MNDSKEWGQAWLDSQKHYWNTLYDWSKSTAENSAAGGADAPKGPEFGDGMDAWWEQVSAVLPREAQEVYRRAIDTGRNFFDMGQLFWKIARESQSEDGDWQSALEDGLQEFKRTLDENSAAAEDAWSGFASGWGLSDFAWRDFMGSLGQTPAATTGVGLDADSAQHAQDAWSRLLNVPAMGCTREMQEQTKEWARLRAEYHNATREHAVLLHTTNGKAVDLLRRRLLELVPKGEAPETLRSMYDLWVDCGEEAYAELAVDDEFLTAQGQLTNSLMRLKRHEGEMVQGVLSSLNIPGRREMDTALCRLQETRRELRDLRDLVEDSGVLELSEEVLRLRQEIEQLRQNARAPVRTAKKVSSKKAGIKKKPGTKKKVTSKQRAGSTKKSVSRRKTADRSAKES